MGGQRTEQEPDDEESEPAQEDRAGTAGIGESPREDDREQLRGVMVALIQGGKRKRRTMPPVPGDANHAAP